MDGLPSSICIGQDYIYNKDIPIVIKCFMPCSFHKKDMLIEENGVKVYFEGVDLVVTYKVCVNANFYNDIRTVEDFIYAIIDVDVLPNLNKVLLTLKYREGFILIKPLTIYDINYIEIIDFEKSIVVATYPPHMEGPFLYREESSCINDKLYIREYMDAISDIIYCDFESSLRRCISTLEIMFNKFNIRSERRKNGRDYFNDKCLVLLSEKHYQYSLKHIKILRWNLWVIYKFRNIIMHDYLRSQFDNSWKNLCHKAIGTIHYILIGCSLVLNEEKDFINSTTNNYLFHADSYIRCFDLDHIKHMVESEPSDKNFITKPSDLDNFMFQGLMYDRGIFDAFKVQLTKRDKEYMGILLKDI